MSNRGTGEARTAGWLAGVCLMGLAALGAGCARSHRVAEEAAEPAIPPVWPAAPEQPRIGYVQSVRRPADLGIKASAFSRFGRWLTGSEKGNEPLVKPFGIALDENDNLCLTDTGANAVCYYERASKRWRRWSRAGTVRFSSPVAVAKRQGLFYVADSGLGCVLAFRETGDLVFATTNHLERPAGLAFAGSRLFVADTQRHRIVSFDERGNYLAEFGRRGSQPGEFNFPSHISTDSAGRLYVTDAMNSRIQVLDAEGNCLGQVGSIGDRPGHFGRPKGVAVDTFGHVYAMDAVYDVMQVFDQSGRILLSVGRTGDEAGEFWLPNGIAISRQNEIYVTDSYNRRLQVFKYIGAS